MQMINTDSISFITSAQEDSCDSFAPELNVLPLTASNMHRVRPFELILQYIVFFISGGMIFHILHLHKSTNMSQNSGAHRWGGYVLYY